MGPPAISACKPNGLLWISYPKGGPSRGATDLPATPWWVQRDVLGEVTSVSGYKPVAFVSVDETWTALRFKRVRDGRKLDVLVTHAPPFGMAEAKDSAHVGFVAALRLIQHFQPLLAAHGHVHPYGRTLPERRAGATRVINVVPSRVIDL